MPNEYIVENNVRREMTDEEQAAEIARREAEANSPATVLSNALASIYEPVEYNGTLYPADQVSIAN